MQLNLKIRAGEPKDNIRALDQLAQISPTVCAVPKACHSLHIPVARSKSEDQSVWAPRVALSDFWSGQDNGLAYDRGTQLYALGRPEAALAAWTDSIRQNPTHATSHQASGAGLRIGLAPTSWGWPVSG